MDPKIEARGLFFYARPGSSDEKTIREVVGKNVYEKRGFKIEPGERWLDLGGNIGAFSVLAASRGADVRTWEPDPSNVAQIRANLALNGLTANVRERCIVGDERKMATLNLWPDGQSWRNSIVRNKRKTIPMEVFCDNFFSFAQPDDCVKMDIEGSEIGILEAWPQGFRVRKLVFEYSFDVDPSCARLRGILERLKAIFPNVKYSSQVDRIEEWKFFPPATMVHCF